MPQVASEENKIEALEEQLSELLNSEDAEALDAFLSDLHPVLLANLLASFDQDTIINLLEHITGLDQLSDVICYASPQIQKLSIKLLDDARIAAIVRRLEADDAADFIGLLPRRHQIGILRRLNTKSAKKITELLRYDEDTAGGIMTPLFVSMNAEIKAADAINKLRQNLKSEVIDPDTNISNIYIVTEDNALLGVCSLRELLTAESDVALSELMEESVVLVHPEDDQETVARTIADYDFSSIPVVSPETNQILGIITVDDVIDAIEEEYTEDILKMAGTEDQDFIGASIFTSVKSRFPWLIASWLGGIGGAMLLGSFSSTLEKIVALAFFMPVVFGMAGNVGSQSSTITVRGLATGVLGSHNVFKRMVKEALVGLCLGLTFGLLLGAAAMSLYNDSQLAVIVASSISVTMTCAALLGSLLPVIMNKAGVDPAVSSGPFVTTTTDVISITIYFSVASLLI